MKITEVRENIENYGIENVDENILLSAMAGKQIYIEDFYNTLVRRHSFEDIVVKFSVTKGETTKLLAI